VAKTTLPFLPWPFEGTKTLVDRGTEACAVEADGTELRAVCLDRTLRARYTLNEQLGGPRVVERERGARWIVVTSTAQAPTGVVLDLAAGRIVARVDVSLSAAVRDPMGELEGLLVTRPSTVLLDASGRVQWTSPEHLDEAVSAVSAGGTVFVVSYSSIAMGARLVAFDRGTGAVRWRGDLQLIPIDHSIYRNHVELAWDDGVLVVRGRESSQEYLEIFAPADGTALFRTVQRR
jgi:hypothetical protein